MPADFQFEQAAMALAAVSRALHARDWVPATSGNFSMRLDNGEIAITASGQDKSRLSADRIMRLDDAGRALEDRKPSAETELHLQLYRRDPGIGAVLHVHSANAVLASLLFSEGIRFEQLELIKAFPGIDTHETELFLPVFANSQDMPQLAATIEAGMAQQGQGHAYLLVGHGLYTWAQDLDQCMVQLEALDHLLNYQLTLYHRNGTS